MAFTKRLGPQPRFATLSSSTLSMTIARVSCVMARYENYAPFSHGVASYALDILQCRARPSTLDIHFCRLIITSQASRLHSSLLPTYPTTFTHNAMINA